MDLSAINTNGAIPLKEILQGAAYYPGSGKDGFPMKVCNTKWADLRINSFVYCDFAFSKEEIQRGALGVIAGYNLVAERWLEPEEYIPQEWSLNLYDSPNGNYRDRRFDSAPEVEHFAVWRIYQRTIHKDDSHGPEWLSFLFVSGEGYATYQQLYLWNKVAPKLIFFVQYYDMIAPKDDWESPQSAFHKMFKASHECAPEWVSSGAHNTIEFALRVWNMEELGARVLGYKNCEEVETLISNGATVEQMECTVLGNRTRKVEAGGRVYLLIGYATGTIVYEIIDKDLSCEELLTQIVKEGYSAHHRKWI